MRQIDFFMEIWATRPHVSEVSGVSLGEEVMSYFFSHILSKGAEPAAKFDPMNIMLMTFHEHSTWENFKHTIREDPMWAPVFQRESEMKIKYNNKNK